MSKRTKPIRYSTYESIPLFLDAIDIANVLGIPRSDAYFLLHAADFPAITIGGRVLVRKEKLFLWLEHHNKTTKEETNERHPQTVKEKNILLH